MRQAVIYKKRKISLRDFVKILKEEFREHIGEENKISMDELLSNLFPESDGWTVWRRYAYCDAIKRCIGVIRRKKNLFIINKNNNFFVLKTQAEAEYFKAILAKDIIGMKKSMIKADEWVAEEKWKHLESESAIDFSEDISDEGEKNNE